MTEQKRKDFAFYGIAVATAALLFGTPAMAEMISAEGMPGLSFCEFLIQSVDKFVAAKS
jgi:hypothetical protein